MPTRLDTNFARLTNPDTFESLIRDICALEWSDPHTQKFGRKGQKQYGVDVYGQPVDLSGIYRAAQCKLRTTDKSLTQTEIEAEVEAAIAFPHELATLLIVTDGPRDTQAQILVDRINKRQVRNHSFKVVIWFWDDITERLAAYPKLIVTYYRDYFANLTVLPTVERLVDTPLQITILNQSSTSEANHLKESLQFRGIRILEQQDLAAISASPLNDIPPDGVVGKYVAHPAESEDATLLKFTSKVRTYVEQVETACPIFVVLPPELSPQFLTYFASLDGHSERVKLLTDDLPLNVIADRIFKALFDYGYTRRGSLTTIDLTARTLDSKPTSALLDLDWRAKLSVHDFPTPKEWGEIYIPALTVVRDKIVGLSDKTRIQIDSRLPLPAAFALGFFFNLRAARVGVWARRTGVSNFKQQFWLSDADAAQVTFTPQWIQSPADKAHTAIVELTSYVDIHRAVELHVKGSEITAEAWLQVSLNSEGKPLANIDESHAVAYATQVGRIIRHLNSNGVTDIHVFARVPSALAVLVGQRLQACGRIHLYWFDNPTYRFAFTLT